MLASQTASIIKTREDRTAWLNAHLRSQYGNKYMGIGSVDTSGEVTGAQVRVQSSLTVRHPLAYHAGMIPASNWHISDEVHVDHYSFTKRIRLFRSAGRVLDGGT